MSFPKYPEYKDSGVEWLGEVPGHWGVKKIGHIAELIAGFAFPSDRFEFDPDSGIPLVRGDNVTEGWLRWGEKGRYWPHGAEYDARYLLAHDDILVQMDGSKVGKNWALVGESDLPALLVQRVTRIRANGALSKFVYSFIANEMFIRYVDRAKTDPAIPHITMKDIADYWITLPPLPEQTQIAAFLDRETAKIDALVAEQRRLMALLKEKRQAVISHAVTQGLNPHAPMKPSGIEWLGDVPEHWEVLKGALIGTLFGSEQVPEDAVLDEGALPFIKVGSLSRDSFEIESWDYFVDESVAANCRPRTDYIVFPKRGAAIFTNKVNIVDRPSLIDPNLMGWQIGERAVTTFVAYALKCRKLDELADVSTVPQINNKHIAPERFAVPPIEEQHQIVTFLNIESAKFDTLTTEAQRAIDLLQERRTALISAAVTGQIDVRGAVQ